MAILSALLGAAIPPLAALAVVVFTTVCAGLAVKSESRGREERLAILVAKIEGIGGNLIGTSGRPESDIDAEAEGMLSSEDRLNAAVERRADDLAVAIGRLTLTQATLRAIIEGVDTPVFATNEAGRLKVCNRAGERLFGRRAERLTGLLLDEVFPSTKLLELHAKARSGVASRGSVTMTFEGVSRVFDVSATPARAAISDTPARLGPWAGVVLTLRDVTDVARATQLKTDFVGNASHELRTPIASIKAAVETMAACPPDDAAMTVRLREMIESNVHRLEEMVADLLDLSHLESEQQALTLRAMPFSELSATMTELFGVAASARSIELAIEADPRLEGLETDPKLAKLILRNLLDNAIKFAHEGSVVRVVADSVPPGGLAIERDHKTLVATSERRDLSTSRSAGGAWFGLRLRVIDQGQGIPIKSQPRIFERFYQVDQARTRGGASKGTGLGLSIVKHATWRLGGDVTVESVWGEGTTMTVELPDCVRPANDARSGSPADDRGGSAGQASPKRVPESG